MNWPLALPQPGYQVLVPGPGWYRLQPVPSATQVDALLALARAQLGTGAVGWLPADGGLVSNLPAWENLLLATQWHAPASLPAIEARIGRWLDVLGRRGELLRAVPGRLLPEERQLVGWLRLMLARPKLLLVEAQSAAVLAQQAPLRALVEEELASAALLCLAHWPLDGFAELAADTTATNILQGSATP